MGQRTVYQLKGCCSNVSKMVQLFGQNLQDFPKLTNVVCHMTKLAVCGGYANNGVDSST